MEQSIDNFSAVSQEKRYPGTAYAVAETINDVTGVFTDRSITYNGS